MGNPFVHVELQTQDVNKAKKFYQGLFDWKLEKEPSMDYTMIKVGDGVGGGMMKCPMPNMPSQWLAYVLVDDVAATLKKAKSLGAKVCVEDKDVMGYGTMGIFIDPTGAMLALWKPTKAK